jgi:hypothetical protein
VAELVALNLPKVMAAAGRPSPLRP